jgi:hypothetical protein
MGWGLFMKRHKKLPFLRDGVFDARQVIQTQILDFQCFLLFSLLAYCLHLLRSYSPFPHITTSCSSLLTSSFPLLISRFSLLVCCSPFLFFFTACFLLSTDHHSFFTSRLSFFASNILLFVHVFLITSLNLANAQLHHNHM